jgi:imidazolonepropionase-like amidohydrolase
MPGRTRGQASLLMLRAYVESGLSPMETIRAATSRAAELLGLQEQVGSLAPRKTADVIAVRGNPTKEIGDVDRVFFVMKGGGVVVRR